MLGGAGAAQRRPAADRQQGPASATASGSLAAVDEERSPPRACSWPAQVAVLRTATTTVAALHARGDRGRRGSLTPGRPSCAGRSARADRGAAGARAAGHRRRRHGLHVPRRARPRRASGPTSSRRRRRHRGARPSAGTPAVLRPGPRTGDGERTPSKWGGFLPPIPFDPLRYGIPPASLAASNRSSCSPWRSRGGRSTDAGYARAADFDRSRTVGGLRRRGGQRPVQRATTLRTLLPGLPAARCRPSWTSSCPGSPRTPSPACSPTSSPAGSPTGSTSAAPTTPSTRPAPPRSPRWTWPARNWPRGTSDMVLCGGADLHNGINDYLLFSSVHALSPTGRSPPLRRARPTASRSARASACVVLKRLADAERDGDRIYARHQGRRQLQRRPVARPDRAPARGPAARPSSAPTAAPASRPPRSGSSRRTAPARWSATAPNSRVAHRGVHRGRGGPGRLRARLGEVADRAHQVRRRPGRADQGRRWRCTPACGRRPCTSSAPNPAWDADSSPFAFHTEAPPVGGAAARTRRGGQRVRLRRHQLPRRARPATPGAAEPAHAPGRLAGRAVLLPGRRPAAAPPGRWSGWRPGWRERRGRAAVARCATWRAADRGRRRHGPVQVAVVADDLDDLAARLSGRRPVRTTGRRRVHAHGTTRRPRPGGVPLPRPGQPAPRHARGVVRRLPRAARRSWTGADAGWSRPCSRRPPSTRRTPRRPAGRAHRHPGRPAGARPRRPPPRTGCSPRSGSAPTARRGTATAS